MRTSTREQAVAIAHSPLRPLVIQALTPPELSQGEVQ